MCAFLPWISDSERGWEMLAQLFSMDMQVIKLIKDMIIRFQPSY